MSRIEENPWQNAVTLFALCISSLAVLFSAFIWKKSKVQVSLVKAEKKACEEAKYGKPEKWVKVGNVKSLLIYPIKSCAGVPVEKGTITKLGLKCENANVRDRDFLVVNDKGRQVTMERYPKMALIKVAFNENNAITVSAPDMPSLTIKFPEPNGENERLCRVKHDAQIKALDCGDDAAQWFSEFLEDSTFRLCYHHMNQSQRTFEPYMYKCPMFETSDLGTFHNETSYLLVAEESIDELNKRLEKNSSWRNWRPTILIDEVAEPFAEVNWSFVRLGNENGILKTAVPCYRCPLTTVDNSDGVLPKDGEPLKTLRHMNIVDKVADKRLTEVLQSKGIMGLRLGLYLPAGEGAVVKVGDPVYAALL